MALKIASRVQEVSTAGFGGTGAVQLGGVPTSPAGRVSFITGVGATHACEFVIADPAGPWERSIGTVTAGSPNTLSRDIVIENSLGTTNLVNFAAGQKDVFLVGPRPAPASVLKTANYTITLADLGRLIDGTGTWTLSLPAAATLGNGFSFAARNSGSGTITIDPNGAETIDGAATLALGPGEAVLAICDGAAFKTVGRAGGALPAGHLTGLTLANNGTDATNDIDIAAGKCRDDADTSDMVLAAALTKQLDAAWAVGTNQGGLDTGAVGNGTYHVWLIRRSDTGVVDALFSLSATAPTMPTNYDQKRRIGPIVRLAGSIKPFSQFADEFLWKSSVLDVNTTTSGTARNTVTLTVPTGIVVHAMINIFAGLLMYVSSPDVNDETPSQTAAPLGSASNSTNTNGSGPFLIRTNTSGQITYKNSSNAIARIATLGFIDRRGRDG